MSHHSPRLFTPGPTPIPLRVKQAMQANLCHHRSDTFEHAQRKLLDQFQTLVGQDTQTLFFTSSGSGAMEAAVASFFSKNDTVLVVHAGKFGMRWKYLCQHYELNTQEVEMPWGRAADLDQIMQAVKQHRPRAVMIQACETSTGAFHPVFALAQALKDTEVLCMVDAITALAIYSFDLNAQGIDVLLGASQKALMCPPGLASVSLSQKACAKLLPTSRSYYFSIQEALQHARRGASVFTPAIPLFFGLSKAVEMLMEEGLPQVYQRHLVLQQATRQFFKCHNFELFNKDEDAAAGLSAVKVDKRFDVGAFIEELRSTHHLWIAGGQEHMQGHLFRFAHMGYCYPGNLALALADVDSVLQKHDRYNKHALPELMANLRNTGHDNPHTD